MLIGLLIVPLAWRFTRRLVAPIAAFADTAERAGRSDRDATFPATGPKEVRTAARALDDMQRRIAGAVEERTRLIAAVAHDLRTPLMRLRFRAHLPAASRGPTGAMSGWRTDRPAGYGRTCACRWRARTSRRSAESHKS